MSINLLVLYEIADRASRVTTKKAYRDFEKWVSNILSTTRDAAVERAARIQLFKLRDVYGLA